MLVLLGKGDDTMAGAAVVSTRILLHQVADIDDKAILDYRHRNPVLGGWIPHLKALSPGLLQENGNGTEVSVGGD